MLERPFIPSDATADAFRHLHKCFLNDPPTSGPIGTSMALSAPEGPSNMLARGLLERAFGQRIEIDLSIASSPTPDPREPLPGADVFLWRRAGDDFEAALPPPDATVQREVGLIASTPYRLDSWAERARILEGLRIMGDYLFGEGDSVQGAFVFEQGGVLSGLEVCAYGTDAPVRLPRPTDLRPRAQGGELSPK